MSITPIQPCGANVGQIEHLLSAENKATKGGQLSRSVQQWNAEGLPAGIYYFRIQAGDKVGGGKMILLR